MSNVDSKNPTDAAPPWEALGITTLPIGNVHVALDILWEMETRITACLVGDTGIGKTPIVSQWAEQKGFYLRAFNFGHMSAEETSMSMFNEDATEFDFVKAAWMRKLNEEAEARGGAILFLDEWNRGDKAMVNKLFTLCDERRIHDHYLHPNVLVVAAMNPSNGQHLVNEAERDPAIRKRLCFMYMTPDHASWCAHAEEAKYHPMVVGLVKAVPTLFYDQQARDAGKVFTCPANWEKASGIVTSAEKQKRLGHGATRSLLAGQLGHDVAETLLEYIRDQNTVIAPVAVLEEYLTTGRQRIAKLLGADINPKTDTLVFNRAQSTRMDVVTTLNEGICLDIFSRKPDPSSIAENLSQYLIDLPDELFQTFLTMSARKQSMISNDNKNYFNRLSKELTSKYPKYAARVSAMYEKQQALDKSLASR